MNATANADHAALQPLISMPTRIAGAVAALAIVAAAAALASQASPKAVDVAFQAMNPAVVHVTLPTVEVHARRQAGDPVAEVACANPHSRI